MSARRCRISSRARLCALDARAPSGANPPPQDLYGRRLGRALTLALAAVKPEIQGEWAARERCPQTSGFPLSRE